MADGLPRRGFYKSLAALGETVAKARTTFRGVPMSSKQRRLIATGKDGRGVHNMRMGGRAAIINRGGFDKPGKKYGKPGTIAVVQGGRGKRTPGATQSAIARRLKTRTGGGIWALHHRISGRNHIKKAKPKTLYVYRPVENSADIIAWAKSQGFATTLAPEDLHVTLADSKTPLNWAKLHDDWHFEPSTEASACGLGPVCRSEDGGNAKRRIKGGVREVKALGAEGAIVLAFESDTLTRRWMDFKGAGAVWSFPSFTPHVTISYDGKGVDLAKVHPYAGEIVLGEECWEEVKEGAQEAAIARQVSKALDALGTRIEAVEKRLEKAD